MSRLPRASARTGSRPFSKIRGLSPPRGRRSRSAPRTGIGRPARCACWAGFASRRRMPGRAGPRQLPRPNKSFISRKSLSWVESRRGAVAQAMRLCPVSPPRSSNRTCGFPASGFPAGFTSTLSAYGLTIQCQAVDAELPEDRFVAEASSASRGHFVPPGKKTPHVLHHVGVDRLVCILTGSVAEVVVPAAQDRVQPVPDFRPGPAVGRM